MMTPSRECRINVDRLAGPDLCSTRPASLIAYAIHPITISRQRVPPAGQIKSGRYPGPADCHRVRLAAL
jgi:hypothetical protein